MVEAERGRFGDKRLADVGNALLASMRSERTLCLPQLAKARNQFVQFGRFVANPAVTTQEMLASTARLTDQRAAGRHVLAIMSLPRRRPGTPPTCASPRTRPASAASAATPTTPAPVCSCIRCWRSMPAMAV